MTIQEGKMAGIDVRQAINVDGLETFAFQLSKQVSSGCSACYNRPDRVRKLLRVWVVRDPNLYHHLAKGQLKQCSQKVKYLHCGSSAVVRDMGTQEMLPD